MDLEQIAAALSCDTLCAAGGDGVDIDVVVASDGMSEILAFHRPHALMLTGLTNIQSVRTAIVADVSAIVYVRGKHPAGEVLHLALQDGIPCFCTSLGMFDCCGILFGAGLRGGM
jgi:hypothetical protein